MSIVNFSLKYTKKIYNASKKFAQDDKYMTDLKPVCKVYWLDQDKIGYYEDGGYTDSPLWDQAEVKEFKDFNRAVAFAQSKYNGDNIVDVDIDIFLPLITRIEYSDYSNFFGSVIPTFYPDSAQLVCIGVIHAYDIDLTVAHKEAYEMFRENYKLIQNKDFAYES